MRRLPRIDLDYFDSDEEDPSTHSEELLNIDASPTNDHQIHTLLRPSKHRRRQKAPRGLTLS